MSAYSDENFLCPYCGSPNEIGVESQVGRAYEITTDCEVCCRPIVVKVRIIGGDYELEIRGENE